MAARGEIAELTDRSVLAVTGPATVDFLQNLLTFDVEAAARAGAGFGGLLSPQGKVLFELLAIANEGGFLIDVARADAAALASRLILYRLRAKVEIADATAVVAVIAAWGADQAPAQPGRLVADPRVRALGFRAYVHRAAVGAAVAAPGFRNVRRVGYEAHRIGLGVPTMGADFEPASTYPHEAGWDALGGVDFRKGCYVGQEVVSRMQHRGTAKSRPARVIGTAPLPAAGMVITAGDRPLGNMGSSADTAGIAIVRLDRAAEAMAVGAPITAGDAPVTLALPDWANFGWPGAGNG